MIHMSYNCRLASDKILNDIPDIKAVVMGHSHKAMVVGNKYANSGTWTNGKRDYIEIKIYESGEITMSKKEWNK